ncbi:bifunctional 5,10-methylene-tetrahydrofolate dehydrogenase/5,10-methylene-tetrahydrofolate cyclohydrolase, partial [bacterium]|nr:bifunctional 5,10-methylene-tetrahydrofolate dehydrogenase/5,10-methylene-tetrahydrofolate cyclohydrolase [bacterium]
MAQLLDGKATAKGMRARLKREIEELAGKVGRPPRMVFIQVGDNPASTTYVKSKQKLAGRIGMVSTIDRLPAEISQDELLTRIRQYNSDRTVHAMLVQLPLPEQ